jgi:hypothetical protein
MAYLLVRSSRTAARQPGSGRRRAIPDARSNFFSELLAHRAWNLQRSSAGLDVLYDDQRITMHHGPVVAGAQLGGKVAGAAAQQGRQFI